MFSKRGEIKGFVREPHESLESLSMLPTNVDLAITIQLEHIVAVILLESQVPAEMAVYVLLLLLTILQCLQHQKKEITK